MREAWRNCIQEWRKKLPLPALAVMALGCLLLLMPVRGTSEEQGQKTDEQECFDLENFERRLEQVIAEIEGVGEARVILSLHGGSRQILAQDRQQDSAGASAQTVTVGRASDRQVVPIQTMAPDFRGALVVCRGADDAGVRLEVTKAVCVLTGLGTDCVCVTTGTS